MNSLDGRPGMMARTLELRRRFAGARRWSTMPERKAPRKTAKSASTTAKYEGFSKEEIAAMKETARERKAAARGEDQAKAVRERIASMPQPDRAMAERVHAIVTATAPDLEPRTWYGMPAYAKDGQVVCFFQDAAKFKARYATLGFTGAATLDEGDMWPTSYALRKLTAADEKRIAALVKRAVS
jgi:uncharacterized protein YdhG (YjbR/CyaY superfamily)